MFSQGSVHTQRTDDHHFSSCLPRVGRWFPKVLCTLRDWKIITSPVVSRESTDVYPGSVHTPRVDHHNLNNCIRESANNPTLTYLTVNVKFVGHVGLVGQTRLSRCMCSLFLWHRMRAQPIGPAQQGRSASMLPRHHQRQKLCRSSIHSIGLRCSAHVDMHQVCNTGL